MSEWEEMFCVTPKPRSLKDSFPLLWHPPRTLLCREHQGTTGWRKKHERKKHLESQITRKTHIIRLFKEQELNFYCPWAAENQGWFVFTFSSVLTNPDITHVSSFQIFVLSSEFFISLLASFLGSVGWQYGCQHLQASVFRVQGQEKRLCIANYLNTASVLVISLPTFRNLAQNELWRPMVSRAWIG